MAKKGEKPLVIHTYNSEVDLKDSEYRAVVQGSADDGCKLPAAAGAGKVVGIVFGKPNEGTGKSLSVVRLGRAKVELAGSVNAQEKLEVADATGKLQKYTAASSNGEVGVAEETGVSGDIISAWIDPHDHSQL